MNNQGEETPEGRGSLNGFYSYKNSFDENSVWLDIPKHGRVGLFRSIVIVIDGYPVVFVDNSDPYADELETSLAESNAMALAQSRNQRWGSGSRASDADSHAMEALSAVGSHDTRYPYSPLDHPSASDSVSYPSPKRSRSSAMLPPASPISLPSISLSTSSNNTNSNPNHNTNINFLLNPSSQSMSPSVASASIQTPDQKSATLPSRPAVSRSSASIDHRVDHNAETEFEIAFLLRHYSEGPGLWYVII